MYKLTEEDTEKIPQNSKSFYNIKKSEKWENSIEIKLNAYEKISIFNLYNILKCYLNTPLFKPISIATCWSIENERIIVLDNIKPKIIENMNYILFEDWFKNKILYDKKYDNNKKFEYLILITYSSKFIKIYNQVHKKDILNLIKPKYTWKITTKSIIIINEIRKEIRKNPKLQYLIWKNKNLKRRPTLIDRRQV